LSKEITDDKALNTSFTPNVGAAFQFENANFACHQQTQVSLLQTWTLRSINAKDMFLLQTQTSIKVAFQDKHELVSVVFQHKMWAYEFCVSTSIRAPRFWCNWQPHRLDQWQPFSLT